MTALTEYQKFMASETEGFIELETIEIWHSEFGETLRFVKEFVSQDLTLEETAPRNPSATVTFTPFAATIKKPQDSGDVEQILSVSISGVNNVINDLCNCNQIVIQGSSITGEDRNAKAWLADYFYL